MLDIFAFLGGLALFLFGLYQIGSRNGDLYERTTAERGLGG